MDRRAVKKCTETLESIDIFIAQTRAAKNAKFAGSRAVGGGGRGGGGPPNTSSNSGSNTHSETPPPPTAVLVQQVEANKRELGKVRDRLKSKSLETNDPRDTAMLQELLRHVDKSWESIRILEKSLLKEVNNSKNAMGGGGHISNSPSVINGGSGSRGNSNNKLTAQVWVKDALGNLRQRINALEIELKSKSEERNASALSDRGVRKNSFLNLSAQDALGCYLRHFSELQSFLLSLQRGDIRSEDVDEIRHEVREVLRDKVDIGSLTNYDMYERLRVKLNHSTTSVNHPINTNDTNITSNQNYNSNNNTGNNIKSLNNRSNSSKGVNQQQGRSRSLSNQATVGSNTAEREALQKSSAGGNALLQRPQNPGTSGTAVNSSSSLSSSSMMGKSGVSGVPNMAEWMKVDEFIHSQLAGRGGGSTAVGHTFLSHQTGVAPRPKNSSEIVPPAQHSVHNRVGKNHYSAVEGTEGELHSEMTALDDEDADAKNDDTFGDDSSWNASPGSLHQIMRLTEQTTKVAFTEEELKRHEERRRQISAGVQRTAEEVEGGHHSRNVQKRAAGVGMTAQEVSSEAERREVQSTITETEKEREKGSGDSGALKAESRGAVGKPKTAVTPAAGMTAGVCTTEPNSKAPRVEGGPSSAPVGSVAAAPTAPAGSVVASKEHAEKTMSELEYARMLEMSVFHMNHPRDVDCQKPFQAPNLVEPVDSFPTEIDPVFYNRKIYEVFDDSVLFFIFYYHQQNFQHNFACRALRLRGFQFRKSNTTWYKVVQVGHHPLPLHLGGKPNSTTSILPSGLSQGSLGDSVPPPSIIKVLRFFDFQGDWKWKDSSHKDTIEIPTSDWLQ